MIFNKLGLVEKWNTQRTQALGHSLLRVLYPLMEQESRTKLLQEAKEFVAQVCVLFITLMQCHTTTYACSHMLTHMQHTHTYTCTRAHTHTHKHTRAYTHTYTCTRTHT